MEQYNYRWNSTRKQHNVIILEKRKYNYSNEVLGSEQCSQSSLISRNSGAILNKMELLITLQCINLISAYSQFNVLLLFYWRSGIIRILLSQSYWVWFWIFCNLAGLTLCVSVTGPLSCNISCPPYTPSPWRIVLLALRLIPSPISYSSGKLEFVSKLIHGNEF